MLGSINDNELERPLPKRPSQITSSASQTGHSFRYRLTIFSAKMSAATSTEHVPDETRPESENERSFKGPLQLSGALDQYQTFNVTPNIGTEFPDTSLKEWIESPNSDELLRDLAITSMFDVYMSLHCAETISSIAARRGLLPQTGRPE